MPSSYAELTTKKFLDASGLGYFASKLNNYPTNDVISAVIDGVQDALDEKLDASSFSNESLGNGICACDTAAATTAKEATLSGYELTPGGTVSVRFTNAVPASATININNTGAKAIYHQNAAIAGDVIDAGDTATFIYDGTRFHLISIDRSETATSITNAEIDELFDSVTPGDNYYKPISNAQIDALFD